MSKGIKVAIIGIGTPLMPKTYTESELRKKLKEQREICAKIIKDGYNLDSIPNSNRVNDMVEEDILNAPEPKI